jgi:outer membrane protein TolC
MPDTNYGQDSTGNLQPIGSLEQAIEYALKHNPGAQAAHARWQSAREEATIAGSWPEPSLNFAQFLEPIETRNGPQQQQIGLNQMIPIWGTTGLKRQIAMRKAEKAQHDYEAARIRVMSQVKSAWADLHWVHQSMETIRQYQVLLVTFQDIAETRYATGKGMQTSVLKAQLEQTNLEEKLLNFAEMRVNSAHKLNGLLNRPVDAPVTEDPDLDLPELTMSEQQLIQLLGEQRQDLQGLRSLIEANRTMVSLAGKKNLPSLGLGVNYITIGEPSIAMGAPEAGADGLAVMAKIDLPLWFGANKSRIRQAKLDLASMQYRYADVRNSAEAEVRSGYFTIMQTQKSLDLYRDRLIPEAEQTLNSAMAAYKTGSISFLDLLDSERMIVQFKLNYYKEQAAYVKAIASLESSIGTQLP